MKNDRDASVTPELAPSRSRGRHRLSRAIVVAVGAAALAALAAQFASVHAARPSSWWWLELLRFLPYPIYLLLALLACGAAIRLGRFWLLSAALVLALVVTVFMGLSVGGLPGRVDDGWGHVRLMTYNVKAYLAEHDPAGFPALAWEVSLHDPDVFVMQDASQLSAAREARPGTVSALFAGRAVYTYGQYIVASRFPMRDCRPGQIPHGGEPHTYVRCTVSAHGVDFELITVHFLSPRDGLNAARHEQLAGLDAWRENFSARLMQAGRLGSDIASIHRPVVVAGDLNAPEGSPVVRALLDLGLRDAFSSAGRGYGYTHGHTLWPYVSILRIDHILVSDSIGVTSAHVGSERGSDHRPVIADLLMHRSQH